MDSYTLLDSGQFRKLEQVGPYVIVRPAPTAVWNPLLPDKKWATADAEFVRFSDGNGDWKVRHAECKKPFNIEISKLTFEIKLTSFGHLGVFPEQASNWLKLREAASNLKKWQDSVKVLNLFAYTGGSSLAVASGGAEVTHVDASKGTVKWASENAKLSNLGEKPIRWIVDDVKEFVAREVRRGSVYDGIILDPPSYGKGDKKNQVWKIEQDLLPLMSELKKIFSDVKGSFICLSAHSEGYTPQSLKNQLMSVFGPSSQIVSEEMLIPEDGGRHLPSGASALWVKA